MHSVSISTLISASMPIYKIYNQQNLCVKYDSVQNKILSFTWKLSVTVLNFIVQRFCNKVATCSVSMNFNSLFDSIKTDILKIAVTLVLWYKICTYSSVSQIFEYS